MSLLASVAESRQSIPILSNIYIKAENDLITLIATDLEIELSFKIECDSILEPGETTVSARKIFDLTRSLSDETPLEFNLKENQLIVQLYSEGDVATKFSVPSKEGMKFAPVAGQRWQRVGGQLHMYRSMSSRPCPCGRAFLYRSWFRVYV